MKKKISAPFTLRCITLALGTHIALAQGSTVAQNTSARNAPAPAPGTSARATAYGDDALWSTPWEFTLSPFTTYHWSRDPTHKPVILIGLEKHPPSSNWFWGAVFFTNSFGQPTVFAYYGYEWDRLFGWQNVYAKIAAGAMYGYVGKYQHKVPLNYKGLSPGIVPTIGYHFGSRDAVQVSVLGTAGLLFSYSRKF
ncbi:MAG: ABC transporter ATP-binding protein [Burkholderiaceae bacterium]|nr:ABC transporter ATP-binding protein [Burkholderiaceae bacterium]